MIEIKVSKKTIVYVAIIVFAGLVLDQVTKAIIASTMSSSDRISVIGDFFTITHHRNHGAAFGIMQGKYWLMMLFTVIASVLFLWLLNNSDKEKYPIFTTSIGLMISGMLGNWIDRTFRDGVVDFLDFDFGFYDFPVFNVADMLLVIGTGLFIFAIFKEDVEAFD